MKARQLLNLIPQETWDRLSLETHVDHKAKKLERQDYFNLLLYSLLNVKENSLRVMERTFNSYLFQQLQPQSGSPNIRHSSIGERLQNINAEFFEKLYQDCLSQYAKQVNERDDKILRFDSTMVSISAKLIDIGFICGGGHDNSRQLKFTMGFSDVPEYASFHHDSAFNSENVALKHAILGCKSTKDKIVLFDRGVQARDTYDELTEKGILFITRVNPNPRCKQETENIILTPIESEDLVIDEDSKKKLINRNEKITRYSYRYIHVVRNTGDQIAFLTNIETISAEQVAAIYKRRWDIEVFFKFLKQELNFSHLLSRNENGIKVILYTTLILSILLTAYKKLNKLSGYKITKIAFALDLEEELIKYLIHLNTENGESKKPFFDTT